jgi:hypothetical protein
VLHGIENCAVTLETFPIDATRGRIARAVVRFADERQVGRAEIVDVGRQRGIVAARSRHCRIEDGLHRRQRGADQIGQHARMWTLAGWTVHPERTIFHLHSTQPSHTDR